jgi:hypothetical protein
MKKKIRMKMRTFATLSLSLSLSLCFCTRDGNRTRTALQPQDFKSCVSTSSTTRAFEFGVFRNRNRALTKTFPSPIFLLLLNTFQKNGTKKKSRPHSTGIHGARDETRTRDPNLGKVMLYQLSYSRLIKERFEGRKCTQAFTLCKCLMKFFWNFTSKSSQFRS